MFTTVRKWLGGFFPVNGNGHPQPQEMYRPRERLLYEFWDGEKHVKADPMVLWNALMEVWPDLIVDMKLANSQHSQATKGWHAQIIKVRKVFSIKPFEEGGLTETESMAILYDFWAWCEELKKNYPQTPTSAGATSPTSGSTSAASPPTSSTSPSTSTGSESSTGDPGPSK